MNKTGKILVLSILSLILLVSVVSMASATDDDNIKLDPFLRRLIEDQKPSEAFEIKSLDTLKTVSVIIRADSGEDISSELKGIEGVEVHSIIGDIITLDVPISAIKTIASIPGVVYIEASKPLKLLLDKSVPATKANEVWNMTYKGQNITGKDVIVAVIDTGIDWTHGDFKKPEGTSRILYIWDQTLTAQAGEIVPQPYNYGVEYTQAQINAALVGTGTVREQDTDGHGTHCAGIAAGNGLSTSPPTYIGMAPEADIIVVKSNLTTATVIDAMNYVKNKAQALEKPVVVSCSFGAHWDAHDGTTSEEKVIDTLSGGGAVFVVAAGNEAEDDIHATGTVTHGGSVTTKFNIPSIPVIPGTSYQEVDVNIWYEGTDSMNVTVTAPTIGTSPEVAPGEWKGWDTQDGRIIIDARSAPWSGNGDNNIYIEINNLGGTSVRTGTWSFTLSGITIIDGRFDAWLPLGAGGEFFTNADPQITIGEPATANKAIAVGAYTTKPSSDYGKIASFSSKGPTRDGRQKPEITAPGKKITSARSGGGYTPKSGTSMSCPHVAGAVALMLQVNSTLDYATISNIINDTAVTDAFTGSTWNPTWGWGKLDAKAAVLQLDKTPPTYSQVSSDNTEVGEPTLLSAYWCDNIGLNGFNLSTNNSGSWINTSYPMSGQCNWSNATITLNSTAHLTIGWIIYANDTSGNWNNTGIQTILTADTKSPIVTSATANPPTIFADGTHDTLLNVTATDSSGIKSVTVNLSAIGRSETQELQNNSGVWQCTTNTTINGTFELPVNVTDNEGNSNTNATIALEAVSIGTDLIFTYRDSLLTTPADLFEDNATVFVVVTDGNTTGGNKTITVNNTYNESINVTVYDDGTNSDIPNDKNYTGYFNITSGVTNDNTDELRLNEGDTATITANLANDSLAGTKTISRAIKCFIATAAYGTPLHEDIDVLRDFRDEHLMTNPVGEKFVRVYYATSPPIAGVISENEGLRTIVREGLVKPLVYIVRVLD